MKGRGNGSNTRKLWKGARHAGATISNVRTEENGARGFPGVESKCTTATVEVRECERAQVSLGRAGSLRPIPAVLLLARRVWETSNANREKMWGATWHLESTDKRVRHRRRPNGHVEPSWKKRPRWHTPLPRVLCQCASHSHTHPHAPNRAQSVHT